MSSIHQFKVSGISGEEIRFADFEGKNILIVNVASECGFTPQYQQLQELYETFHHKFVVIAFPCNDFGGQEPGSNEEIEAFCQKKYGVSFPIATKVNIKSDPIDTIYQWLTKKEANGVLDDNVRWNFHKFLLDEQGKLLKAMPSNISPFDEAILSCLQ